jgi:hypothetical protein
MCAFNKRLFRVTQSNNNNKKYQKYHWYSERASFSHVASIYHSISFDMLNGYYKRENLYSHEPLLCVCCAHKHIVIIIIFHLNFMRYGSNNNTTTNVFIKNSCWAFNCCPKRYIPRCLMHFLYAQSFSCSRACVFIGKLSHTHTFI